MKWFGYFFLALIAGALFLPHRDSGIRNVPLLLGILGCIAIFLAYNFLSLLLLAHKVKKKLKRKGFQAKITRLFIRTGYIVAKNKEETVEVLLLLRRKNYCRQHFSDENHIEWWKSTRLVTKRNMAGNIARGAVDTRMVGKTTISWNTLTPEKENGRMIVMNKLPNRISDSAKSEEISSGDCICSSNIVLFDLNGFLNYMNQSVQ
ncbi:MAG: hypothetical protein IJW16_02850 [Clostridia bacterium]|nr:hypothetical protein [Clostridia bacterium]